MINEQEFEVRGLKRVQYLLDRMPEMFNDEATELVRNRTFKIHSKISSNVTDGSNGTLKSRTGELRRSIRPRITGTSSFSSLRAGVSTTSKYAPIHEFGGTIEAKDKFLHLPGGPYLSIPSEDNKTASGVTQKTPREVFEEGGFTIPINAPSADYMMMLENEPMYWLVNEVKIPKRLGFRDAFNEEVPKLGNDLHELMGSKADELLRQGGY